MGRVPSSGSASARPCLIEDTGVARVRQGASDAAFDRRRGLRRLPRPRPRPPELPSVTTQPSALRAYRPRAGAVKTPP